MEQPTSPRIPAHELTRFAVAVLGAAGVPDEDARVVAVSLVEAQLRGVASHGLQLLPLYVNVLREGEVNPRPAMTRPVDAGTTATIDGDGALGQLVATAAIDLATEKALAYGVGVVVGRRAFHTGALAPYAERAAARGCIGLVISEGGRLMAPAGGLGKLVGNNPLAYAFPTRRGFPLVLDFAMSAVSGFTVTDYERSGRPLPAGWIRDGAGRPTTDPAVFTATMGADAGGTLVPIGEHKGYTLAVAHDILSGVLAGGQFGKGLGIPEDSVSVYAQAVRIDRFLPLEAYYDRLDQLIDQLKAAPPAPGSAGVVVPGERAHARRAAALAAGVALAPATLAALRHLADDLGVPPPAPDAAPAA
jgi:LDH2 family malate/lactate/ureidoglycolate dehydrogenase